MTSQDERRRAARQHFPVPLIGAVHSPSKENLSGPVVSLEPAVFVDMHDLSETGAQVESSRRISPNSVWLLLYQDPMLNEWKMCPVKPVWSRFDPVGKFRAGVSFLEGAQAVSPADSCKVGNLRSIDIEFLTNMPLLDTIPRHAFCHLLNCLELRTFKAGDKIIRQGDAGDSLYIVQEGICSVKVEQDGQVHSINRVHLGELVGEMAVLTGEPRSAHVEAETDVAAWKLGKDDFEEVSTRYPDLRNFLTELVARRFESSPRTADRTIGKYLIKRKLGKGGWSIVYEGFHTTLNVPVAIKMMRHDMALDPSFLERFRREAQLIARLNHRNIVHVFDIEESYRTVFIVMEYLEGQPLEHILAHAGPLPPRRAVNYLTQICSGLKYAHEHGIVHQDIKPANIFITSNDRVKILDFGLACTSGNEDLCFLGTVFYTAPEQILGKPVGPFTDIFALGFTAYEMLTGTRPFAEDDLNAVIDMHLNADIPDPAKLVPDMPDALRRFILKACRRNPKRRYESAADALKELAPLARRMGCPDEDSVAESRKMTTLFLIYNEEQQLAVQRLLEKFSQKVQDRGVILKIADFKDV